MNKFIRVRSSSLYCLLTSFLCYSLSSVALIFFATLALAPVVLGDSPPQQNNKSTTDQKSKYYLLLDDNSLYDNQLYQSQIKQIERLGQAHDLKGLTDLADMIEQTWGHQTDTRGYFALMDTVCSILRSYNFGPKNLYKQDEQTKKYVLLTLEHGNVPLDITSRLLPCLVPGEELMTYKRPFDATAWAQLRTARAPLWLETRQRLKELVIPGYDMHIQIVTGMPLDYDKLNDPVDLAERRKAIQERDRILRGRNTQTLMRFMDDLFSSSTEAEMLLYYSHAPYNTDELKRLLSTYAVDAGTQQRILDQVSKNIASAAQK